MLRGHSKLFLVLVLVLALTPAAWAEDAPATAADTTDAPEATVEVAGMQVAIDPATGELRQPTAEERKALADAFRASFGRMAHARGLGTSQRMADGTLAYVVGPEHASFSLAHIDADGELVTECIDGPEQTAEALEAAPADNSPEKE